MKCSPHASRICLSVPLMLLLSLAATVVTGSGMLGSAAEGPATGNAASSEAAETEQSSARREGELTFGFWNLENLFDTEDDPHNPGDNEFLPDKGWTPERYQRKLAHLAEILAETQPHILGVCEVENRRVLTDLIAHPALASHGFEVVHLDSPDKRGIDLGLIYRAPVKYVDKSAKIHEIPMSPPTRGVFECRLDVGGEGCCRSALYRSG